MFDGSEKRDRQLAFELQNSHVCEKRSKSALKNAFLEKKKVLPLYTAKPRLTATSVIQSPRYYGHFFWPPGSLSTLN